MIESLKGALKLYNESYQEGATSFGQTVYVDDKYVGDVWVFGIDEQDEKMAMLSIVIFDKTYWGKGVGNEVVREFAKVCLSKFDIEKIGAFTYAHNERAINALEKAGFDLIERFVEDGI